MAARPLSGASGKTLLVPAANTTTFTKGNMVVDNGSGYITNVAAGGNADVHFITLETVTTTSTGQLVLCLRTKGVRFEVDTDAAPAQTDVGTYCDIAAAGTLNPDASTDDVFFIDGIVDTSTTVVRGHFTEGVPNS